MSDASDSRDPLDELGEEFLDRLRRGQHPDVTEFAARDPERAAEIREFLSALLFVEGLKPQADPTLDAARPGAVGPGPGLDRLGDFRIIRELGRGGMGVVYEAEQESLGRHVALKVLAPGVARSPQQVRRFVREARSAARLHHTNIVPVFGVGEHEGVPYYAMQYIPGLGLDKVVQEVRRLRGLAPPAAAPEPSATVVETATSTVDGRPAAPPAGEPDLGPPSRPSALAESADSDARYARGVARIGLQVAEALEYSHQQGTLHRDVKPSNILLDAHGVAWVTDFGLAKAAQDEDLTRTGDLVGTIRYMAPERFRGRGDARADVYGLGLVLYELLAMRPAFGASDRESLFDQVHRVQPPRLRSVNRAVPRDLDTIVHKAIEKDPGHRYATAAALAEDLRRFLEDRPIVARRVGSTERITRWARHNPGLATLGSALAAMLALVVVLIAWADFRLRGEHADVLFQLHRAERAEAEAVGRLLDSYVAQARASRRGRFAGRRGDGLRALAEATRLDPRGARRLELRDEAIACLALPDLRARPPWRGRAEDGYLGVDLDPATGRLARSQADGTILIQGEGPYDPPLALPGDGSRPVFLRFSPDGRFLVARCERGPGATLVAWDVRRASRVLAVPDGLHAIAADFHPDGRTLAAGRRDGSIVLYDLDAGREVRRLAPGAVPRELRFDASGRRFAVSSPNSREGVQVREFADGALVAAWKPPEPAYSLAWHPDGRLAVGTEDGRIRVYSPDDPGRAPRVVGVHDGQVIALAYHPAGTLLASASWDGSIRLWDVRTGQELLKGVLPEARPIRFSRDGRLLGPGHDAGASWAWELDEGVESRWLVGHEGLGDRTWSVDFLHAGGLLASAGGAGVRLEAMAGDGPSALLVLPGTQGLAALPDGSALLTGGATGLLRWPVRRDAEGEVRVGPPAPVGPLAGLPTGRLRLGPDGRTLAVAIDGEAGRVLVQDLEGGGAPVEIAGHPSLERLALSPDGRWVATGTWKGSRVKVWDARSGALVRDLPVEGSAEVLFSPDGRRLATGSGSEYVLWEVGTWTPLVRISRSQAGDLPGVAAFAPDGRTLAVARTRSTVQLLDPESGRVRATLEAPEPQNVAGLGFRPDGRALVVTYNAARIQVWDLSALRRGLAALGLDWDEPGPSGTEPPPAPSRVVVESAPWLEPLARGEALARAGRWDEAAAAFDAGIAAGAPHVEPRMRRLLLLRARGDDAAYRRGCRELRDRFDPSRAAPSVVNDLAWTCALGPGAIGPDDPLIRLAQAAATSRPQPNRLNTVGAVLYRAGRFAEAIPWLERSIAVHGAGGTAYDALFLALAHHRLGHPDEARRWLERGCAPAPASLLKPDALGDTSWIPRLELDFLRREVAETLGPAGP